MRGEAIKDPDILIIPGSKNTIEDLLYLKSCGLDEQIIRLSRKGKRVVGICGGYQILGQSIKDPYFTESAVSETSGLGLLDIETVFETEKMTTQISGVIENMESTPLAELSGKKINGYEIHMGVSTRLDDCKAFLKIEDRLGEEVNVLDGAINEKGNVFGTYIHGIFDDIDFTRTYLNLIRTEKGFDKLESEIKNMEEFKDNEYNKLADLIREHIDMDKVYEILKGE